MERKERIKYKQKYQEALKKLDDIKNLDKSNPIDLTRIIESAASRAYRIESNIELLRTGFNNAESITNPLYFPLQKVYNEIIMDSHVTSCIQIRKNYVLSREFSLLNKAGIVDEKSEAFFDKRWLTDFMNMVLDSIWYGYSLIKIGDIVDDVLEGVELVHRTNSNPKTKRILQSPYAVYSGESFIEDPTKDWFILASDTKDSHYEGLFAKIGTYQILLKIAQQALAEYTERFGSPQIVVKTGQTSNTKYINDISLYLQQFNRTGFAIFSNLDEIDLVESSGKSAEVYISLITEMKANISKLILGTENLGDEKSFVGSAEISEGIANMYSLNDINYVEYYINDELIPRLIKLGLTFLTDITFKFDIANKTNPADEFAMMIQLIQAGYKVDASVIKEKFGLTVENPTASAGLFSTEQEDNTLLKEDNNDV